MKQLIKELFEAIAFLINCMIDIYCFFIIGLNLFGFADTDVKTLIIICFFGIYSSINVLYKMLSDKISTPQKDGNG